MISITEILQMLGAKLALEGINEDIVIHSETIFNKLSYEFSTDRRFEVPYGKHTIQMYTQSGIIKVFKEPPEPSRDEIEKKVRDELNRRAMYSQKYSR